MVQPFDTEDIPVFKDIVPDIDGYDKLPTKMLERMAAGNDLDAQRELDRRVPPPPGAPDPDALPTGAKHGPALFADVVYTEKPYHALPSRLLKNLALDGSVGAGEELQRRNLPLD